MEERAWIAETTRGAEASDFDGEGRIRFDDGPFAGFMERVPVRPGIALYRLEGHSAEPWTLKAQGSTVIFTTKLSAFGTPCRNQERHRRERPHLIRPWIYA